MSRPRRIASLCSGYGGLIKAAHNLLGGELAWYAQYEPPDKLGRPDRNQYAAQVMAQHWPGVPNHGDITAIDWTAVEPVDVIEAGFPCTDISNAGKRIGISGKKSGIWKNVAEAVRVLRPRLVLLENVAAIRSRGLDVVAQDLAEIGYDARWTCVRAGDPEVGAPHQRDRWFCIAHPAAEDPDLSAWRERRPAAAGEAEGGRPRADAGGRGGLPAAAGELSLFPTPKASDGPHGGPNQRDASGNYYLPGLAVRLELIPTPVVADARGTRNFTAGRREGAEFNSGKTLTDFAWLLEEPGVSWVATDGTDYTPAIRRWEAVTGRRAPFPTEAGTRGNRRLAPEFAEWLMGLPAGWVTGRGIPRKDELQMIGNGVVPQQAEHAYRLLLGCRQPAAAGR